MFCSYFIFIEEKNSLCNFRINTFWNEIFATNIFKREGQNRTLIFLFLITLYIFLNIIKSNKDHIFDSEKQSKFILDCIKEDKTKTVRVIGDCERISIKLYCK